MIKLAKDLMGRDNWLILDTETTGLGETDQVCQIGILDRAGEVVLDTLVKPTIPIPPQLKQIHGIDDEAVADAPTYADLHPRLVEILSNREIVVYNVFYDLRMLRQSCLVHFPDWRPLHCLYPGATWTDVMEPYAEYWGDWNSYHRSFTWQKLGTACEQQGIEVKAAHSAIGDCRMTLALIQAIAATQD